MKKSIYLAGLMAAFIILSAPQNVQAAVFTVWADSVADQALDRNNDTALGLINGYEGSIGGRRNYNYFSFSGHPLNGPNTTANRLKIFMYTNTNNGLTFFNIIAHKDGANGRHSYNADVEISGSLSDPRIRRGDEGRELTEVSEDKFEGRWNMRRNSDGGAIGALYGNGWEIELSISNSTLTRHVFASNGTSNIRFDNKPYRTYYITPGDSRFSGAIPEPSTFVLLGLGIIGLSFRSRAKRNS